MVHFFEVNDGHGEIYSWGIDGDRDEAIKFVDGLVQSKNIRAAMYQNSKPPDKFCTGKQKLSPTLLSVYCKHKRRLQTIRN